MKMDYKMRVTPEQSRAVQEACFANGIGWGAGDTEIKYEEQPYLFIQAACITYTDDTAEEFFQQHSYELITPEAFIKMLTAPNAHPLAELMRQYALDAAETKTPWERWQYKREFDDRWMNLSTHPTWHVDVRYRRKPDTIKVGKHEFPKPIQRAPEQGATYWAVYVNYAGASVMEYKWDGCRTEEMLLSANLCHLTEEAARQHADVLNAINRGDV